MDVEVANIKTNVNNLSHCLHALLKRIEQLECTNSNIEHYHFANNMSKTISDTIDELISMNDTKERNDKDSDVKVSLIFFI